MNSLDWQKRIVNRSDMTTRITHLTKGTDDENAFECLWKILNDKELIATVSNGNIVGTNEVVCFQDVPLYGIVENLMYEKELNDKTRYSWFGLRFSKNRIYESGARPVMYGEREELKKLLSEDEFWRIVNFDLSGKNITDWSHEREWRIKGNYKFDYKDIEILVKNDIYSHKLIKRCIDEKRTDILLNCHGIIPLNSVVR